jgi:NitT/TauT family transport system substrate-binding protein
LYFSKQRETEYAKRGVREVDMAFPVRSPCVSRSACPLSALFARPRSPSGTAKTAPRTAFPAIRATAFITAVFLAACGCQPKPPQTITLRIGLYSTQDYLPYFVMKEQGFDKRHGLKFEEKLSYAGGAAVIEDIVSGGLDVGFVGSVPVIAAADRGQVPGKITIVAGNNTADPDHPGAGLLVGQSVNTWKDLEGKFVAVNAMNSIQSAAVRARLKQEGVGNCTLTEISFSNMGLAVAGGSVAAATMYEPFLTQSLLRGDGKLLDWIIGGPPFVRMQNTVIVFSTALFRSNPGAVKAFLRSHLDAAGWIDRNPDAARTVLANNLHLSREVGQRIKLLHWPLDASIDPASMEHVQSVMTDIGMLKGKFPVNQLFDETLLNEVRGEKR